MNLNQTTPPTKHWLNDCDWKIAEETLNDEIQTTLKELKDMQVYPLVTKAEIIRVHRAMMRRLKFDLIRAADFLIPRVQRETLLAWYSTVKPEEVQEWQDNLTQIITQLQESIFLAEEIQISVQYSLDIVKENNHLAKEARKKQHQEEQDKEPMTLRQIANWLSQSFERGSRNEEVVTKQT